MDAVRKLIRLLLRRSSSSSSTNVDVDSDTGARNWELPRPQTQTQSQPPHSVNAPGQASRQTMKSSPILQRHMAATSSAPLRSGGGYDGCGSEDYLVRATRELLTQAATLPLSRRHELLAEAAALPDLAALFQTEAASTPSAAATSDTTSSADAPADGPRPAVPNRLDLPNMKRKLIELAEGVRASRPMPAPAAAALPAPSPLKAPLPESEQQQQQQGGPEPMDVGEPAAAVVAAVAASADALSVSVIPEYDQYGMEVGETVRAVVSIKAISEVPKRAQVALTCVLDRSGSMCGQPMELVQETVHFLIDQLTPDDYLGLVSYSGNVREDLPLLRMTTAGRTVAHRVVDELRASGSTALYDGLVAGVRQQMAAEVELRGSGGGAGNAQGEASSSSSSRLVHSCFLFTDGQATNGPSSPSDIVSELQKLQAPSGQHVTVHTFGFGKGHSVELLQAVAEAQSGMYYYISCTDDIASCFGDALGGLLAVVAKSVQVEVRPRPGVSLTAFRSGGRVIAAASSPTTTTTSRLTSRGRAGSAAAAAAAVPTGAVFNDVFTEETRECLLVLSISPAPGLHADQSTAMELVVVDLSYTDVATGARVSRSAALHVRRTAAGRPAGQLPAELVFVTAARFETLDAIEAARRAADEASDGEDVSGAHRLLDEQLGRLQSSPLQVPALTALAEQTRVAKISIKPRSKRDQAGVAAVAGATQALKHQRVATSAMASPSFYAQYDHKCKATVRQTARALVTSSRAAKLLSKVNEDP